MVRVAQFLAVSEVQLAKDWADALPGWPAPGEIRMPRRATAGSAGYDFFSPTDFALEPGQTILLPTGVRARMEEGWVLMLFPRSGLGFRYRLQLDNTTGIIDADYFYAENEGHIMLKLTNDSKTGKTLRIHAGEGVAQGVFLPFGVTVEDAAQGRRMGGFGSTDQMKG